MKRKIRGGSPQRMSNSVREIIGRGYSGQVNPSAYYGRNYAPFTTDLRQADYQFWDKFRRGEAWGYRLAGLMAQPIAQVTADWVFSGGLSIGLIDDARGNPQAIDYTNKQLGMFVDSMMGMLLTMTADLYSLGDMYLVVNPDGSVACPSPDSVELKHDPTDWRKIIKATIRTRTPDAMIEDVYTVDKRVVTIQVVGKKKKQTIYDNLIGRIPVIHFANDRGTNELFGRPIYEALLFLFQRYDDLLMKSLDGVEMMGNPIPAFEGLKSIEETYDYVTEPVSEASSDIEDELETESTERRIPWDKLPALFLGEGGTFSFKSPGSFTGDVLNMLKMLFYLTIDRSRLPEVVWGTQLGQARASSIEQLETFFMYIEARRLMLEGEGANGGLTSQTRDGLHALCDIWLRTKRLCDPRFVVAPVRMKWGKLRKTDKEKLMPWVQWLHDKMLITDETAVASAEIVDDPAVEIEAAKSQRAPVEPAAPAPAPTAQQPAAEIQEMDGEPFFIGLSLASDPELIDLQSRVKQLMNGSEVAWSNPSDFHVTLIYAPVATEEQVKVAKQALFNLKPPDMSLGIGSLKTFDNLGEYAVHFRIRRNTALLDFQRKLYDICAKAGMQLSQFSNPAAYIPHVTMGYAKQRPAAVTFDSKVIVSPKEAIIEHGEQPVDAASVPQSVEETKQNRFLARIGDIYRAHLTDAGIAPSTIAEMVGKQRQRITVSEAIQATRIDFESTVEDVVGAAVAGRIDRRKFGNALRNAIEVGIRKAYLDGLEDGGVTGAELSDDDMDWLNRWMDKQRQFVINLTNAIYKDDRVTPGEVDGKAIMWWNGSVAPAYAQALVSAASNASFERVLGNTEEHCRDCKRIAGQVRRASFWKRIGIWGASGKTECGGWQCECKNVPTDRPLSRGRFPILYGPKGKGISQMHTHEHSYLEAVMG
jgi:2'-5' RNA ligase